MDFIKGLNSKNAIFLDVTPCGSTEKRRFGGNYRLHLQGNNIRRARNIINTPILVPLMMMAIRSTGTSFITTATEHNISEDGILHRYRRENLKSYRYEFH
jgi:hypothetical protein